MENEADALAMVNEYAAEHLIISTVDATEKQRKL
jgi:histidinol dehydrogenase